MTAWSAENDVTGETGEHLKIIAVDPGVMTGYCYAYLENDEKDVLRYVPFEMTDEVDQFWDRLAQIQPRFIVMEDFEFRMGQRYKGAGLNMFPMELIGVARLYEMKAPHQCSIFLQKPSYGKQYYTDMTLRKLGLYKRGIPHGMDASRHLLQWFTFGAGYKYNNGSPKEFAEMITQAAWKERFGG
jgi:hypothetical protein